MMQKPWGLVRYSHEQCERNWRPMIGLQNAYDLEAQGLVTVTFLRSHTQQYNQLCQVEYWSTYLVEPTEAGLKLLDEYDAEWDALDGEP